MKYFALATFLLFSRANAFESANGHYALDGNLLRTCNRMIDELNEKIELQRRLLYLLQKITLMKKWTPKNKQSILTKLKINREKLSHFMLKVEKKISRIQEKITRRYCPGIILEDNPNNIENEKIFSLEKEILEKALNDQYADR